MIQITSQLSLLETIAEGKINKRQQQVLDCFEFTTGFQEFKYVGRNTFTKIFNNRELSEITKLPINVITARTNELVKLGKLVEAKKARDNITNRLVIYWRLA